MVIERALAVGVLLALAFLPVRYLQFFVVPETQLIVGTLVVIFLLAVDVVGGLLLGIGLLMAYLRVYSSKYGISWNRGMQYPNQSLVDGEAYVTPEFLESAQNNIVDTQSFATEMKGIQGVYGEAVYGAQALGDGGLPGWAPPPPGDEVAFQ